MNCENKDHPAEEELTKSHHDSTSVVDGFELMSWMVKSIASPPRELLKIQSYIILTFLLIFIYFTWLNWDALPGSLSFIMTAGCCLSFYAAYLIMLIVRQKTIFRYCVYTSRATVKFHLHYPDFAGWMFKGLAVFVIFLFSGIAIFTGSLIFLVGPVAMALVAAKKLLGWSNEEKYEQSCMWGEYNFFTIDSARLIVVAHRTDPTIGFEFRFSSEKILSDFLRTIKPMLSTTVTYTHKKWDW